MDAGRDGFRVLTVATFTEQDAELVAAHAGNEVG